MDKIIIRIVLILYFVYCVSCVEKELDFCRINPYEHRICTTYICPENHHEINNTYESDATLGCTISLHKSDKEVEHIFPTWFVPRYNMSNFYEKLNIDNQNDTFCIKRNESLMDNIHANKLEIGRTLQICTRKKGKLNMVVRNFQKASTFISPLFIFFPIVIFMMTQEIQNVHSYTHFTNGFCIFVLYVSWGLKYIIFRDQYVETTACIYFGATLHYFHLSVFSWIVVANYDLLKLSQAHPSVKSLDIKRSISFYIQLSSFAWGIPFIYMGFTTFISWIFFHFGMKVNSKLSLYILPEYGRYRCFIGFHAYWLHLVLPCTVLLAIAMVFITKTVIILRKKNNETMDHALKKVNVIRNIACLKVLILMTIGWGCDILRSLMTAYDRDGMLWLRVIFDAIVAYQTVPVCIIYTCRPHILNHLESKFPKFKGAVEVSRKLFFVSKKEVDPGLVTHLRINRRKSDVVSEDILQETHL